MPKMMGERIKGILEVDESTKVAKRGKKWSKNLSIILRILCICCIHMQRIQASSLHILSQKSVRLADQILKFFKAYGLVYNW